MVSWGRALGVFCFVYSGQVKATGGGATEKYQLSLVFMTVTELLIHPYTYTSCARNECISTFFFQRDPEDPRVSQLHSTVRVTTNTQYHY